MWRRYHVEDLIRYFGQIRDSLKKEPSQTGSSPVTAKGFFDSLFSRFSYLRETKGVRTYEESLQLLSERKVDADTVKPFLEGVIARGPDYQAIYRGYPEFREELERRVQTIEDEARTAQLESSLNSMGITVCWEKDEPNYGDFCKDKNES